MKFASRLGRCHRHAMRQQLLVTLLCACTKAEAHECVDEAGKKTPALDQIELTQTKWSELPGWADDKHHEAVPAFLGSCVKLAELKDDDPVGVDGHGGKAKQWRSACDRASKLKPGDNKAAREFFESEFTPWQAAGKSGPVGKLTGYFVQEVHASRKRGGKYTVPILGRPADLVMVELSQFIQDAHGRRIWGRHDNQGSVVPYFTRSEVRSGALAAQKLELMYANDPVDVLFAQIEGSAKAAMDDGTTVWLQFDGKNGHKYRGVGGILKDKGVLTGIYNGTMAGIRKWFADNPSGFDEVADRNPSFVFFKESKLPGAVGSQGVVLTARRSLAIDRAFIAHGTPIWVATRAPRVGATGTAAWQHLVVAQDTGSGILGAVRGDIYWGDDAAAAELGGRMGGEGRYWLLLPTGVTQ